MQCWGAQGGNVTGTYAVNGSKGAYAAGWYKIATFDWAPYIQVLNEL